MLGVGPLEAVQRRHSDVNVTVFDQRTHVAEQQCQQQGGNVGAVHIGVGHNHDLVVTQLSKLKIFTNAGTKSGDQRADSVAGQGAV